MSNISENKDLVANNTFFWPATDIRLKENNSILGQNMDSTIKNKKSENTVSQNRPLSIFDKQKFYLPNVSNGNKEIKKPKIIKEIVVCKNSKEEFVKMSDFNTQKEVIEFRPIMFKEEKKQNPYIFFSKKDQFEVKNNFNFEILEYNLIEQEYHDLEVIQMMKFGIKTNKCFNPSEKFFDEGSAYPFGNKKAVTNYFDEKIEGPYTRQQIIEKAKGPIVVGKILVVSQGIKDRIVIDKRNKFLEFEKLYPEPYKMRLPSLRDVFKLIDVFKVNSINIVDYSGYFRQIPVSNHDLACCILKNKRGFYIDKYAQMGSRDVPLCAQRITNSLNYLFNVQNKNLAACLGYEDDTVIFNYTKEGEKISKNFIILSEAVGLKVKESKCVLGDDIKIATWLGIEYNFENLSISPSTKRIESILALIQSFEAKGSTTLTTIQSFLGKISSFCEMNTIKGVMHNLRELDTNSASSSSINFSQSHFLELEIIKSLLEKMKNQTTTFEVMQFMVNEENYQIQHQLHENKEIEKIIELKEITLKRLPTQDYCWFTADSSLEKSGGILVFHDEVWRFEYEHKKIRKLSIDRYESFVLVVATVLCMQLFKKARGCVAFTDNEVARYSFSKNSCRNKELQKLTCMLAFYVNIKSWWHSTKRITTVENTIADQISRSKTTAQIKNNSKEVDHRILSKTLNTIRKWTFDFKYEHFLRVLKRSGTLF